MTIKLLRDTLFRMEKPIVFISHITEEKAVATALKALVEASFLSMIDVFVSSDPASIPLGQKWLDNITFGLKRCAVAIVIASPESVRRPWINFEAGAGWIRDIPVIPLCHSGMTPARLPQPLGTLQAATATEEAELKLILPVLSKPLGSTLPTVDFAPFIHAVKEFESLAKERAALIASVPLAMTDGLAAHEIEVLLTIADETDAPNLPVSVHAIRNSMGRAGYRNVATNLAFRLLEQREMIRIAEVEDRYNEGSYPAATITEGGWLWIIANQSIVDLKTTPKSPARSAGLSDDIPF
jgi:hypothetical protein